MCTLQSSANGVVVGTQNIEVSCSVCSREGADASYILATLHHAEMEVVKEFYFMSFLVTKETQALLSWVHSGKILLFSTFTPFSF